MAQVLGLKKFVPFLNIEPKGLEEREDKIWESLKDYLELFKENLFFLWVITFRNFFSSIFNTLWNDCL